MEINFESEEKVTLALTADQQETYTSFYELKRILTSDVRDLKSILTNQSVTLMLSSEIPSRLLS